jgi:hypothetical protein
MAAITARRHLSSGDVAGFAYVACKIQQWRPEFRIPLCWYVLIPDLLS